MISFTLIELYALSQLPGKAPLLPYLVPGVYSTTLYTRGIGFYGRKLFYAFCAQDAEALRIKDILTTLPALYAKTILEARTAYAEFLKNLQNPKRTSYCSLPSFPLINAPFLDKINATYERLAQELGLKRGLWSRLKPAFLYASIFTGVANCQKIAHLESLTETLLPIKELLAIATSSPLTEEETEVVKEWASKVKTVDLMSLHEGLKALLKESKVFHSDALPKIECYLKSLGLSQFFESDSHYLSWRWQCETERRVLGKKKEYLLDQRLGPYKSRGNRHLAYSLTQEPDKVLIMGCNLAHLKMEPLLPHLLPRPTLFEATERYTIVERLVALRDQQWTSTAIKEVARFLSILNRLECTPPLNLGDVGFSREGTLKAMRPFEPGKTRDFNRLVKWALECAQGNIKVFKELMHRSGLSQDPIAHFYRETAAIACLANTTPESIDALAARFNISDASIRTHAKEMQQQLLQIKDRCCGEVLQRAPSQNPLEVEKCVQKAIKTIYEKGNSAGLIWETFEQECLLVIRLPVKA